MYTMLCKKFPFTFCYIFCIMTNISIYWNVGMDDRNALECEDG